MFWRSNFHFFLTFLFANVSWASSYSFFLSDVVWLLLCCVSIFFWSVIMIISIILLDDNYNKNAVVMTLLIGVEDRKIWISTRAFSGCSWNGIVLDLIFLRHGSIHVPFDEKLRGRKELNYCNLKDSKWQGLPVRESPLKKV